jgi:hypothetical protein
VDLPSTYYERRVARRRVRTDGAEIREEIMMEKPNAQSNASPHSEQFRAFCKDLADEQKRLRILREQKESIRLQKEKELWRSASDFPKASLEVRGAKQKKGASPSSSNFFTKMRLRSLFE